MAELVEDRNLKVITHLKELSNLGVIDHEHIGPFLKKRSKIIYKMVANNSTVEDHCAFFDYEVAMIVYIFKGKVKQTHVPIPQNIIWNWLGQTVGFWSRSVKKFKNQPGCKRLFTQFILICEQNGWLPFITEEILRLLPFIRDEDEFVDFVIRLFQKNNLNDQATRATTLFTIGRKDPTATFHLFKTAFQRIDKETEINYKSRDFKQHDLDRDYGNALFAAMIEIMADKSFTPETFWKMMVFLMSNVKATITVTDSFVDDRQVAKKGWVIQCIRLFLPHIETMKVLLQKYYHMSILYLSIVGYGLNQGIQMILERPDAEDILPLLMSSGLLPKPDPSCFDETYLKLYNQIVKITSP